MTIYAGRYSTNEIPAPTSYEFQDAAGAPLPELVAEDASFEATFAWALGRDGEAQERPAELDGATSTHTWEEGDLDGPGIVYGQFTVDNGTNRYKSERIAFLISASIEAEAGS